MTIPGAGPRPLLLGHRGARLAALENSTAAFDLALKHGCDGFEFDVRRTADGRPVICHDPKLAGMVVAAETYDSIARRFETEFLPTSVCESRGALPESCALLTLDEVISRYADRAYLDIELKVPGLEEITLRAIRVSAPRRGCLVSSFLPEVIERVHELDMQLSLGLICDRRSPLARWSSLPVAVVLPHHSLVTRELIEAAHTAGRQVFVWTVNDELAMWRLAGWGVDGIISDDTELLARTLAR